MKLYELKSAPSLTGEVFWVVTTIDTANKKVTTTAFPTWEGAKTSMDKRLLRDRKEASAFSILSHLSVNLLSCKEHELYKDLAVTKCVGISPRQYGYLKGIYERQQRSF